MHMFDHFFSTMCSTMTIFNEIAYFCQGQSSNQNLRKPSRRPKVGLRTTICQPNLSAQQYRSANHACILTPWFTANS